MTVKQNGRVRQTKPTKVTGPSKGVKRFFLTSAQNNTDVFQAAWDNIQALCLHYDARLVVSPYTYFKKLWTQSGEITPGSEKKSDTEATWWDPQLKPYLVLEQLQLGKSLVFCAGMNILPTAVNPLAGLELHTGRQSAIYPHAKMQLSSVASGKYEGTKLMYTTGAVTKRNYLQKKAGQTAEPHHCYGGLIVEIHEDGSFYVRQVQADERGVLHDLDLRVQGGVVYTDNPVEAITWGDIHAFKMDPVVEEQCWGEGGMLDTLQPKHQFFHDVFDMYARNHHERKNPHRMFERMVMGIDAIENEADITANFLKKADRPWCRSIAVKSNHDDAFERWLQSMDCVVDRDAKNLTLWHEGNLEWYRQAALGNTSFLPIEWLLQRHGAPGSIQFLREDESFLLCKEALGRDAIECGMHGHMGANGAKGSLRGFAKMGRRTNTADKHCAGIFNGAYQSGVSGKLDMWYNKGPSTWSHSHIITYPNGMRTIVTMWKGRWRG